MTKRIYRTHGRLAEFEGRTCSIRDFASHEEQYAERQEVMRLLCGLTILDCQSVQNGGNACLVLESSNGQRIEGTGYYGSGGSFQATWDDDVNHEGGMVV